MIRTVVRGALLQRPAYLRMVLSGDGMADGLLIVGAVWLLDGFLIRGRGLGGVDRVAIVLSGIFGWVILSGLVYLIGKHLLRGYGSFQGVAAAAALSAPPMLMAIPLSYVLSFRIAWLIASAWMVACLWMTARVALDLSADKAALAAGGGWLAWVVLMLYVF